MPRATLCVCKLVVSMTMDMMRCDREDSRFILVEATWRRACDRDEQGEAQAQQGGRGQPKGPTSSGRAAQPSAAYPACVPGSTLRCPAHLATLEHTHQLARAGDVLHHGHTRHGDHALGVLLDLQLGRFHLLQGAQRGAHLGVGLGRKAGALRVQQPPPPACAASPGARPSCSLQAGPAGRHSRAQACSRKPERRGQ